MDAGTTAVLTLGGLQALLAALQSRDYRILGPRVRDGAIGYGDIASVADLPRGWGEEQSAGRYRLVRRDDEALFGYAVGPDTWKRFFHRPVEALWRSRRVDGEVQVIAEPEPAERLALIGVRACELRAIAIQDRVLRDGDYPDTRYRARRNAAFIVAVNCGQAGGCPLRWRRPERRRRQFRRERRSDAAVPQAPQRQRHCQSRSGNDGHQVPRVRSAPGRNPWSLAARHPWKRKTSCPPPDRS